MRSDLVAALASSLLLVAVCAPPAVARQIEWPQTLFNPKPGPDDVVLPMPCGGAMTFRRVVTGSVVDTRSAALGDKLITMGTEQPEGRNVLDFRRDEHVAGPFEQGGERYYLIGKYEVTEPQYEAVMGASCPQPSIWTGLFPKNKVNWYDGIAFTRAYNAWLVENAADLLPLAPAGRAFVRLPTDVEWEFAARGGLAVADSERGADMFDLDGMPLANFAWLSSPETGTEVQPIGAKQPNPLGLHDVIGNVEEIVLDAFRMNRVGRLHGQVGGFTARGGSLRTDPNLATLAFREEFAFYETNGAGEVRRDTLGLRLVVGAAAIGGVDNFDRLDEAFEAVRETGGDGPPSADQRLEEIAREEAEALRRELESAVARLDATTAERAAVEARRNELERLVEEQSARLERRLSELRSQLQSEAARRAEAEARNAETMLMSALVLLNELDKTAYAIAIFTEDAQYATTPEEAAEIMDVVRAHVALFEDVGLAYTDVLLQLSSDLGAQLVDAAETLTAELTARGQADTFQPLLTRAVPHIEAFRDGRLDARSILRIIAEEAREEAGRL